MGSDNTTPDLAGVLRISKRAVEDAKAGVEGAREQVALLQEVVRTVTDVDTIKALADTTRLSILRALSRDRVPKSAKELAEELAQPQTKLYRHLKVLQEAGLIEAAETRVVSGIVETKYRAMQSSVSINPSEHPDETRVAMHTMIGGNFDDYRDRMLAAMDAAGPESDEEAAKRRGMLMNLSATISVAQADDFQDRLEALVAEFDAMPRDPGGVRVEGIISWFRPPAPAGPEEDRPASGSA